MKIPPLLCIRILCIALAFAIPVPLYAREHAGWSVTNFNNENGLPQNSVKYIEMDHEGYLWLATEAGIVRYDGQRFRLFDNSNSALECDRYWKIGLDNKGCIYCIDDALKISFYGHKTGFSRPVPLPNVVLATDGGLIDRDRIDMGKLAPLTSGPRNGAYTDNLVFTYHATGKEKGYIVWGSSLAGYVSNGKVQRTDSIDLYPGANLAIGSVGDRLCYINRNRDFVLIDSNGVRTYQKIPFTVPWYKLQHYVPAVAFFRQKHQLLFNVDGNIYEVRFADNKLQFQHLINVQDIPGITSIRYYPQKNLLAIGTLTEGLYLFKKKHMKAVGKGYNKKVNALYAIAPYGKNQIIATSGTLPNGAMIPGITEAINRYSILHDHKGHYWYGSGYNLLETDDRFHILKRIPLLQEALKCVQEDEEGTIWLSQGHREFGRIVADTFQRYELDSLSGKGIKTVNSFLPAGNQTFWLVGYHLCIWLDVQHHRQHIYHEFDSMELRTAYLDKKGNLWLGSYGNGYFLLRNGRFVKMPEDKAHSLSSVHCFLEDDKGYIWMTTNNGLFQCAVNDLYDYAAGKREQIYHHYYGKESGLKTSEFNGGCTPSGLRLDDGSFAFPSMNGVVRFHPDSIRPVLPDNKLFMEQLLLDGVAVPDTMLSKIPPSFKRLELTVSSPYFGNPNNLNIEYNIAGLDDHWYPLADNNHIVLNRLEYGTYKIRLRKEAGFGAGNYVITTLSLRVMPFFYQTWWFRLLAGCGIILLVIVIIRLRYRHLLRQRDRLEAEVKDRTGALVYQNKLMEKLTVMIGHDLKSPLHFLSKVTGHLHNHIREEDFQWIDQTTGEIKNTADQVYQFVEEFNLWASSFNEGFSIHKTSFALDALLQELGLFFKEMLEANGNKLFITAPVNLTLHTDRRLLKVILRNIIDNANKHTQGCDITISVYTEREGHIALTIADTGKGMSEPVLNRIQERIAQASTAAGIERNSRMGYQIIIDFAMRLNAKLQVESGAGKGTSVTLYIAGNIRAANMADHLPEEIISTG